MRNYVTIVMLKKCRILKLKLTKQDQTSSSAPVQLSPVSPRSKLSPCEFKAGYVFHGVLISTCLSGPRSFQAIFFLRLSTGQCFGIDVFSSNWQFQLLCKSQIPNPILIPFILKNKFQFQIQFQILFKYF